MWPCTLRAWAPYLQTSPVVKAARRRGQVSGGNRATGLRLGLATARLGQPRDDGRPLLLVSGVGGVSTHRGHLGESIPRLRPIPAGEVGRRPVAAQDGPWLTQVEGPLPGFLPTPGPCGAPLSPPGWFADRAPMPLAFRATSAPVNPPVGTLPPVGAAPTTGAFAGAGRM